MFLSYFKGFFHFGQWIAGLDPALDLPVLDDSDRSYLEKSQLVVDLWIGERLVPPQPLEDERAGSEARGEIRGETGEA